MVHFCVIVEPQASVSRATNKDSYGMVIIVPTFSQTQMLPWQCLGEKKRTGGKGLSGDQTLPTSFQRLCEVTINDVFLLPASSRTCRDKSKKEALQGCEVIEE